VPISKSFISALPKLSHYLFYEKVDTRVNFRLNPSYSGNSLIIVPTCISVGLGGIMFKDLFNFGKVRTPKEAISFYFIYTGAFLLLSALFGAL